MLIEIDEYKKKVPGYYPEKSEFFHRESAKLADKDFIEHLKSGNYREVIFMAGGAASGKSEFSTSFLIGDDQLIYDGTLKNFDGFKIKLSNVKRYAKNKPSIKVVLIIPDDWKQAFEIFLARERKMSIETFFDTHIRSKIAVARVLLETEINVEIFTSKPIPEKFNLSFEQLPKIDTSELVKKLLTSAQELESHATSRALAIDINYDIFQKYESE